MSQGHSLPPARPKVPRLYHRKSKSGCTRCRERRVKCDEVRPICNKCSIHNVPCVYDRESFPSTAESSNPIRAARVSGIQKASHLEKADMRLLDHAPLMIDYQQESLPETERRKLELRLLHHYVTSTSQTFAACHNQDVFDIWSTTVPKIALQHDNLLYQVFSIAALHLLREEPSNEKLQQARDFYQTLALQEQGKAIAVMSIETADAVCFTSVIMLIDSFATLRDRPHEPWTSPSQWIQMARGVGSVFTVALNNLLDKEQAQIMVIVNAKPSLEDAGTLFSAPNREDLLNLLNHNHLDTDRPWDSETRTAYEQTLSYIGSIRVAIINQEHILAICRRLCAFALLIPKKFLQFVEEKRPRALVMLSYYFACASQMEEVWWLEDVAKKEIYGIWKILSPGWKELMKWPMAQAGFDQKFAT